MFNRDKDTAGQLNHGGWAGATSAPTEPEPKQHVVRNLLIAIPIIMAVLYGLMTLAGWLFG